VKYRLVLPLVVVCAVLGYLALFGSARERVARLFSLDHEIPVEVASAQRRALGRTVTARGELLPLREVRVSSIIPGTVKEIRFATGEKVARGAVVAVIEAADLGERLAAQEAAIKEAEAQLKKRESQLVDAEKQAGELRDLYQKNLIARRETELAEAAVQMAQAQKEAAEAQLAQHRSLAAQTRHVLGLMRVTAPVAGVVSRRWVEPGAAVNESSPLISISAVESLKMVAHVKSADTEELAPGAPTQVIVDEMPERVFRGKVKQIQELANFSGDESSVEIEVPNPNNALNAGMSASAALKLGDTREAIFIPVQALGQSRAREAHVFVVQNGKARRRPVVLGGEQDGEVEVVSGLERGDAVVISSLERLRDGSRVVAVQ
jgi:RND family efflux transporter MFP subunit